MTVETDYGQMQRVSREILETALQLKQTMDDTEHLVFSLSSCWEGAAATEYSAQIVGIKRQFADILTFTTELANAVQSFAEKYRDFDITLKAEFDNI